MKTNYRSKTAGEGLAVVIILLLLLGGGLWWLYIHKQSIDKEARAFGREMVKRVAVDHDLAFFSSHLSPQARLDFPEMQQQEIIKQFAQLGVPAQPIQIDENVTWESQFFEPRGLFTGHLNYPAGPATLEIGIDHPASRWQVTTFNFNPPRGR
jgi:hypothetical protein